MSQMRYAANMNASETRKHDYATIRVPLTEDEKKLLDEHIRHGRYFKGGWIRNAILEQIAREKDGAA